MYVKVKLSSHGSHIHTITTPNLFCIASQPVRYLYLSHCAFNDCTVSWKKGGLSIFNVPRRDDEWSSNWRKQLIDIITKYRVVDTQFKSQIDRKEVAICERHFTEDLKIIRKFSWISQLQIQLYSYTIHTSQVKVYSSHSFYLFTECTAIQ